MSDRGNWKEVNSHNLLIKIVEVKLRQNVSFSGNNGDYISIIDSNDAPVDSIKVVTTNGAAQVRLKAGPLFNGVEQIVLAYENKSQW